jgi:vacuolar-type H+-ATPase subunit I/STV1
MSEVQKIDAPPSKAEKIEQAWSKATAAPSKVEAPITKEDLSDGKPAEGSAKSDRELVAPSIREFLRAQQPAPEPSALEREIADLRQALDALAKPQTPKQVSVEQQMLGKLEALEAREAAREQEERERSEAEAYNSRLTALREGALENIRVRASDYPGLSALKQEETVVNALFARLQEGQETSEEEVASEVETGLREVYETLHRVYGSKQSEERLPVSERRTLSNTLTASDTPVDYSKMSRKEKIDYLWSKANKI